MTNDNIITNLELITDLDAACIRNIPGPCLWAGKWISNTYFPSGSIQHMAGEWETCCQRPFANPNIQWYQQPNIYELLKYLIYEKKITFEFSPAQLTIKGNSTFMDLNSFHIKLFSRQTFEEFLERSLTEYFRKYIEKSQNTY